MNSTRFSQLQLRRDCAFADAVAVSDDVDGSPTLPQDDPRREPEGEPR